MIGISKLYAGTVEPSDFLRYGRKAANLPSHLLQFSEDKKPVVVWNMTRACNMACSHCYASATFQAAPDELNDAESCAFIDHLGEYGAPVLLFSGGEPLTHPKIFEYIKRAVKNGLRAVLSSNGLLIDRSVAEKLADLGLSYVGISLDGLEQRHDDFRRLPGAFKRTLTAIATARDAGLKVGLRFTLSQKNVQDLPGIFDLMENEGIPRVCFYHLVYSGRGQDLTGDALSHEDSRRAIDYIADRTFQAHQNGRKLEVLTVDNHADGPYLYLKALKDGDNQKAKNILELLRLNGGNGSGHAIGAVSWNGDVHPDQFWRNIVLGSLREKTFAGIWHDKNNELLQSLKNKKAHVTGRCRKCVFLDCCGGNLRARAQGNGNGLWGVDPACYLTDEEISTAL